MCLKAGADRYLSELQQVAEEQERQRRRTGARFCGAKYQGSVSDAVNYFTCKTILEPMSVPDTWASFASLRRDYTLGQACRELASVADLSELEKEWQALGVEYSDIVGGR